jgi:hypothetical protein
MSPREYRTRGTPGAAPDDDEIAAHGRPDEVTSLARGRYRRRFAVLGGGIAALITLAALALGLGMWERAHIAAGTLTADLHPDGHFLVHAHLPLAP